MSSCLCIKPRAEAGIGVAGISTVAFVPMCSIAHIIPGISVLMTQDDAVGWAGGVWIRCLEELEKFGGLAGRGIAKENVINVGALRSSSVDLAAGVVPCACNAVIGARPNSARMKIRMNECIGVFLVNGYKVRQAPLRLSCEPLKANSP